MERVCVRPHCNEPATAVLSMDYGAGTVWLDDIDGERPPSSYDVCSTHADRQTVPKGWTLDDRRRAARPLFVSPPLAS